MGFLTNKTALSKKSESFTKGKVNTIQALLGGSSLADIVSQLFVRIKLMGKNK